MDDYWGFSPSALEALGRVTVAMSRCEYFAALLVWGHDESVDPRQLMSVPGAARRAMAKVPGEEIASAHTDLEALVVERNRLTHDVAGSQVFVDGAWVPIVLSTARGTSGRMQSVPSADQILNLVGRIEEMSRRLGKIFRPSDPVE